MGHASMRAALIYQHATSERDREIARPWTGASPGRPTQTGKGTRMARKIQTGRSEKAQVPRSCGLPGPSWVERATGIEPAPSVWKTEALPLSYARGRPAVTGRADSVPNARRRTRSRVRRLPVRTAASDLRVPGTSVSATLLPRQASARAAALRPGSGIVAERAAVAQPGDAAPGCAGRWGLGGCGGSVPAPARPGAPTAYTSRRHGVWRSLVAHSLWERGAVGSNPATPTVVRGRVAPGAADFSARYPGAAGAAARLAYTRWAQSRPDSTEIRQGVRL